MLKTASKLSLVKSTVLTTSLPFLRVAVIDFISVLVGFSKEYLAVALCSNSFLLIVISFNTGLSVSLTKFSIALSKFWVASFTAFWVVSLSLLTVFAEARTVVKLVQDEVV